MARKNVSVAYMLERANYLLNSSEDSQADERKGVCSMIELALHKSGNYKGYNYLDSAGVQSNAYNEAWEQFRSGDPRRNTPPDWNDFCKDDTRRFYHANANTRS